MMLLYSELMGPGGAQRCPNAKELDANPAMKYENVDAFVRFWEAVCLRGGLGTHGWGAPGFRCVCHMNFRWIPYGFHVIFIWNVDPKHVFIWFPYDSHMNSYEFHMIPIWIASDFHVISIWISCAFHMITIWISYGSHMEFYMISYDSHMISYDWWCDVM